MTTSKTRGESLWLQPAMGPALRTAVLAIMLALIGWAIRCAAAEPLFPSADSSTGLYRDGWLSPIFTTVIKADPGVMAVVLTGEVLPHSATAADAMIVTLSVDGHAPRIFRLAPGNFSLTAPLSLKDPPHLLRLETSNPVRLPNGDGRRVSLHLLRMEAINLSKTPPVVATGQKIAQLFTGAGIYPDGWVANEGSFEIPVFEPCRVLLQFEVPLAPDHHTARLQIRSNKRPDPLVIRQLVPGVQEIAFNVGPEDGRLTITADNPFALASPDTRQVAGRILSIRVEP